MNIKLTSIAAGMAVLMALTAGVSANTQHNDQVRRMAPATPTAMTFFCRKYEGECATRGASSVRLTADLMKVLDQVNKRVNRAISYRGESADIWTLNPRSGDCEDYALSKRSALIQMGVPAGSLRIAVTATPRGVPHAILVVKTSGGDVVLDNRSNAVKELRASGYRVQMMSSANPLRWVAG
ncbi:transglutaminase-like cysteine peptidase [Devosia sp.]|uniref:transglutaminase-like cysteine peptidase n=1 Tax=Devosia sp. TaxID=1871048 RepID=UPI002FCC9CD4